jgi:hypothetical protein
MMVGKELMRRINQIAQLRAREAFEQEKRSLTAELRQVAGARGMSNSTCAGRSGPRLPSCSGVGSVVWRARRRPHPERRAPRASA